MKRVSTAFALTALAAATIALAQAEPQTPVGPPAGNTPQQQYPSPTTQPSDRSAGTHSESGADKESLIKNCMAAQKASNSGMSETESKRFCENQVNKVSPQG